MEHYEMEITGLAFGGEGVGRIDNMVCFVPYTAPGDRIRLRITEKKKRFLRGEMTELIVPSKERVEAPCPVFGRCGGCQWQHISYDAQLTAKRDHLRQTLVRMAQLHIEPPQLVPSPAIYNYRRSARVKISKRGRIGFHSRQSHRFVPIDTCPVFEPALNGHLPVMRSELAELHRSPNEAELLRRDDGEVRHAFLWTGEHSKLGFAQANEAINRTLQNEISSYLSARLSEEETVLDLFCGDGNLSIPLARRGMKVRGYDISEPAVTRAQQRAAELGLEQAVYSRAPYQKIISTLSAQADSYGAMILDPPRAGLEEKAGEIAALAVPRVVYVSCIPAILARDLLFFLKCGYTIEHVQPMDMFPQTFHLETVVCLALESAA
jgi:23S rRNA (uracil1939-C5)-methyltransferase